MENVELPDGGHTGDPCAELNCPENTHCEANGETDLNVQDHCVVDDEPQCTLDCPPGNVCELITVTCITSPCPPVQVCTDLPDSGVSAPTYTHDAGTVEPITEPIIDAGTTEPTPPSDAGTTAPEPTIDAGVTEPEPEPTSDAGTNTDAPVTNASANTADEVLKL